MEPGIVDAQVVGEFVEDRSADLDPELLVVEPEVEVGSAEDADPVRKGSPIVTSVEERDPLVEAEQALAFGVLFCGGPLLDHHVQVVDLFEDPVGERVEHVVDGSLELGQVHAAIQAPGCWQYWPMGRMDGLLVAGLVGLVGLAVFAALAETSLLRASTVRVQARADDGDRGARRLAGLQQRMAVVLNAILLVALLSQIGAAALAGVLAQRWFGNLGVTLSSIVLTAVLFVYAEAIPKTFAVRHPENVGGRLSGAIALLEWVVRPVVRVLVRVADLQAPGRGVSTGPTITEQELKLLAHSAAREGEITEDDRHFIERAFLLGDRRADDLLVPRTEMVAVAVTATAGDALDLALRSGHRRLPVFEHDLDAVVGIVHVRDLVGVGEEPISAVMRAPLFVPESKRVVDLLREMQAGRIHIAVVVDEHGGTAGLITIEDVVEEFFGPIALGSQSHGVLRRGQGWEVPGSLQVEDLQVIAGVEGLPEGDWNTAAGLVMGLLGRVPAVGDEVVVEGCVLRVTAMDGRRVMRLGLEPVGGGAGE